MKTPQIEALPGMTPLGIKSMESMRKLQSQAFFNELSHEQRTDENTQDLFITGQTELFTKQNINQK